MSDESKMFEYQFDGAMIPIGANDRYQITLSHLPVPRSGHILVAELSAPVERPFIMQGVNVLMYGFTDDAGVDYGDDLALVTRRQYALPHQIVPWRTVEEIAAYVEKCGEVGIADAIREMRFRR